MTKYLLPHNKQGGKAGAMLPYEKSKGNPGTALLQKALDQALLCGLQSQLG